MEPGNKSPGRKSLTSSSRCNGAAPVIVFPPKLATEDKSLEAVSRDGARTAESREPRRWGGIFSLIDLISVDISERHFLNDFGFCLQHPDNVDQVVQTLTQLNIKSDWNQISKCVDNALTPPVCHKLTSSVIQFQFTNWQMWDGRLSKLIFWFTKILTVRFVSHQSSRYLVICV